MKQVLFIHIPRTAGTSMNDLARNLVPSYQDLGFPLRPKCDPDSYWTTTQHLSIQSLLDRKVFTQEWFDSCFKFAFIRNPWDRLLSLYRHLKGYRPKQKRKRDSNRCLRDFPAFVQAVVAGVYVKPLGKLVTDDFSQANAQTEWLQWGVDFIGRYETLDEDWNRLCEKIGMPQCNLPYENKTEARQAYQSYYNTSTRGMVADLYAEEIERFGFTFDD